jgi:mannose-1-phosphate guanylyltransferase
MYVVILAGGGGTRLWPLSRPERPKPFLPLVTDETLLQRTVRRVLPLVDGPGDVYCVTDRKYGYLVQSQVPSIHLIVEPAGRNTAAAIALATAAIPRPDDEVMTVLPADHWIEDEAGFQGVLAASARSLATGAFGIEDPLVTLGVQPTRPATEYGYLVPEMLGGRSIDGLSAHRLQAFEEKPTEQRARELLGTPDVAWNAGIFLWKRAAIRTALEKFTPLPMLIDQSLGSELALRNAYERVNAISIDKAVMEGAASDHRVVMAAMDIGWNDVGSWPALLRAIAGPPAGDVTGRVVQPGEHVDVGSNDLVVRPVGGRLVAQTASEVDGSGDGAIVAGGVWAHLAGAAPLIDDVRRLLARVDEARVEAGEVRA